MTLKNVPVRVIITMMARLKNGGLKPRPLRATPLKSTLGRKSLKSTTRKRRRSGELSKLKKKLWVLCKLIVRAECMKKHGKLVCYTSGKVVAGSDAHTGHFIHSSLCSVELRFDLKNLQIQSYDQNINKNGNTLQYRLNLIRDHGQEYVDELWRRNEATKGTVYSKDWFISKIGDYEKILNET